MMYSEQGKQDSDLESQERTPIHTYVCSQERTPTHTYVCSSEKCCFLCLKIVAIYLSSFAVSDIFCMYLPTVFQLHRFAHLFLSISLFVIFHLLILFFDADGMSSMIGLPSDRALVEDDECLRLFIFKNVLNLPLLMHHDIFFSLFLSPPLIGVERKILKHAQFHINCLIHSHLRCPFNY